MTPITRSVRAVFRTEAVIDWLEIEITVAQATQFQWVQKALRHHFNDGITPHVRAIDPGAGGSSTRFRIVLNDGHCRVHATVRAAIEMLHKRFSLSGPVTVSALEIALDFYPSDSGAVADLAGMVQRLQGSLEVDGRSHRFVSSDGRRKKLCSFDTPNENATFYINNRWDPCSWRVYYKMTDRGNRLPLSLHRARVEVTLQGGELAKYGIGNACDLFEMDFAKLATLFHFRRFKPFSDLVAGKSKVIAHSILRATRRERNFVSLYGFGRQSYYRDKRTNRPRNKGLPYPRKYSVHTVADEELKQVVSDRLHDLNRNFRKNS